MTSQRLALENLAHERARSAVSVVGAAFAVVLVFMQYGFLGALYDTATLLYDRLAVPSLDTPASMARRLGAMQALVERATIKSARSTLCGARNCLEGLLDE